MIKNLVIVESPAKARTIEKFLGKEYLVMSSMGHVVDLKKKDLGVDIEHDFEPQYEVSPDKKKIVADLRKSSKGAKTVWLATDEDREGEAISWHLANQLKISDEKTKRIVFHEITKSAIDR
ncbi:MAG: toprim domain-containing protein, partial [Bacteroidales bacterium]|nr:toprim domain-containing protein [Bacteroidales bacterium]